ncbi:MAG TPA: hypothetical protein VGC34_09960 [Steroidobacteraceae bacterium]
MKSLLVWFALLGCLLSGAVHAQLTLLGAGGNKATASGNLPNLLSSYTHRPAGNVYGVDSWVGLPPGTTLTPWYSISKSGVSVSTSSGLVSCNSGSGTVTLSGIDFTLTAPSGHNGGYIAVSNSQTCPTLILNNDKFGCSSLTGSNNFTVQLQSTSNVALTIENSDFVGDNCQIGQSSAVYTSSSGSVTFLSNFVEDPQGGQMIDFVGGSGVSVAVDIERNLIYFRNGFVSNYPDSHMNFQQFNGGAVTSDVWSNNTVAVLGYPFTNSGEGPQMYGNISPFTINSPQVENNVFVGFYDGHTTCGGPPPGPCPSISHGVHGPLGTAGTTCTGAAVNSGNYFSYKSSGPADGTQGFFNAYYPNSMNGGCWTSSGNISLIDGTAITPGP